MPKVKYVSDIEVEYGVQPLRCGMGSIEQNLYLRRNHGDVVTIAARSGKGKTALANQLAIEVAGREQGAVLFFSFEVSPAELKKRGLSYFSGRSPNELEHLPKEERLAAEKKLAERSLAYVGDARGLSELVDLTDDFSFERRISLIVVDHIQALAVNSRASRKDTISFAMSQLKELAKRHNTPVLLLAQATRDLEKRMHENPTATPMMSDISDAADIEYWSDVVMILADNVRDSLTAHVVKNRHGEQKSFDLEFRGRSGKFIDLNPTLKEIKLV